MDKNKIDIYIAEIKNSFVDKYDDINKSRKIINDYLKSVEITEYDYNSFCLFLLDSLKEKLTKLKENTITEEKMNIVFKNILVKMLIIKLKNSNNPELIETASQLEILLK